MVVVVGEAMIAIVHWTQARIGLAHLTRSLALLARVIGHVPRGTSVRDARAKNDSMHMQCQWSCDHTPLDSS